MRAIITTLPFGEIDPRPLEILRQAGVDFAFNPLGRRLKADEVFSVIKGYDIVIAGTETINREALRSAKPKAICRVGIGLDGVDLVAARELGIAVSYTPDGPSPAVAELALGQMIALLRNAGCADRDIRGGRWQRYFGTRLNLSTVGIIGCGRIGSRLIEHLLGGFPGARILAHDIRGPMIFPNSEKVEWVDLETLLSQSDAISLHVPMTHATRHMIGSRELAMMKATAVLVNTARGGVVDEAALCLSLKKGQIAGAAIDVFEEEPYKGPLTECHNIVLTCHMGSMTRDCRVRMEVEAAEEAVRFATDVPLLSPVPEEEFVLAREAMAALVS